jgi:hypothetical protein
MAGNLTAQVRKHRRRSTTAIGERATCPQESRSTCAASFWTVRKTMNTMVEQLKLFAGEVTRCRARGRHGRQTRRAGERVRTWPDVEDLTDNVNLLAANLTTQVRNIAEVTTAVARGGGVGGGGGGRSSRARSTVDVKGEPSSSRSRSTRWSISSTRSPRGDARGARGRHEGKLGGQAKVPGVAGRGRI